MIQLEDKIISTDIFNKYFLCDLKSCKGACCVEGDAGAPITFEEEIELKKILNDVKPYMTKEGIKAVIQPGGSKNDQLSIDYCNTNGMAMVFTKTRHFKH